MKSVHDVQCTMYRLLTGPLVVGLTDEAEWLDSAPNVFPVLAVCFGSAIVRALPIRFFLLQQPIFSGLHQFALFLTHQRSV